jgi:hypothetical protein
MKIHIFWTSFSNKKENIKYKNIIVNGKIKRKETRNEVK